MGEIFAWGDLVKVVAPRKGLGPLSSPSLTAKFSSRHLFCHSRKPPSVAVTAGTPPRDYRGPMAHAAEFQPAGAKNGGHEVDDSTVDNGGAQGLDPDGLSSDISCKIAHALRRGYIIRLLRKLRDTSNCTSY